MIEAEQRGLLTGFSVGALMGLLLISVETPIPGISILQSLRFHLALPMLILPVLLLVRHAPRRAAFVAAAVFSSLGEGALDIYYQQKLRWTLVGEVDLQPINVLSFNVLEVNKRPTDVVGYLANALPDIAILLETSGIAGSLGKLEETFPYRAGCGSDACDTSIISRTPLYDIRLDTLEFARQRLIVAKTVIRGRQVTIVAAHLTKPYFDSAARAEMWKLTHTLRAIEGPVVLAGDFNAAAWSADVRRFVARSGLVPPPAYPATWPIGLGAFGIPIDNMFTQGGALIQSIEAMSDPVGSNHRGLIAKVALPQLGPSLASNRLGARSTDTRR